MQEEYYSVMQEPGFVYFGHVIPLSDSAKNITNSMISRFPDCDFTLNELDALGCEDTVINTGGRTGVKRSIEREIK